MNWLVISVRMVKVFVRQMESGMVVVCRMIRFCILVMFDVLIEKYVDVFYIDFQDILEVKQGFLKGLYIFKGNSMERLVVFVCYVL